MCRNGSLPRRARARTPACAGPIGRNAGCAWAESRWWTTRGVRSWPFWARGRPRPGEGAEDAWLPVGEWSRCGGLGDDGRDGCEIDLRRLARDYETHPHRSEAMIRVAMIDLISSSLTRESTPNWRYT